MTNIETNVSSTSKTNDVGFYFFPGVSTGQYRVVVVAPGMEKFEVVFSVAVAQSAVIDPQLKPGQTSTTMDVRDVTPVVTLDNPTVAAGMERQRIEQLPINGRSLVTLLAVLPGHEFKRAFGGIEGGMEYFLDGVAAGDRQWAMEPFSLSLDSIQEFAEVTNAASAKYSRPANIVLSTKSGANQIHGSAFETARNNAIGLARRRTDTYSKPPYLNRHEYGASVGGPVIIPKLYNGRDRTFWFFGFEGLRQMSNSTWGYSVPTMAMRNGDFSELKDSQGRLQRLYDPLSTDARGVRQPFSYGGRLNVIDPARMSPVAKYLYSITPEPTNNINPLLDYNWWGPRISITRMNSRNIRVDHRFSDRDSVFVTVNFGGKKSIYDVADGTGGGPILQASNHITGWQHYDYPEKNIGINWVRTFSPTLFSELIVAVHRGTATGGEGDATGINTDIDWADKFNLSNPFNSKNWPFFENTGLSTYNLKTNDTKKNEQNYYTVDENLTKISGKHEIQFGVHVRRNILNVLPMQRYPQPWVNWGTMATALYDTATSLSSPQAVPQTGHNLANMFLGVSYYQNTMTRGWYELVEGDYAGYIQDNFKVTPRLTINAGLRYEFWPTIHDKRNAAVGFSLDKHAIVTGVDMDTLYKAGLTMPSVVAAYQALGAQFITAKEAGLPASMVNTPKANFGPRLGFAYKALDGRASFVLRGGYNRSFFPMPLSAWFENNLNNTPLKAQFSYNPNDATQSPDGYPNWLLRNTPVYFDGVNTRNVIDLNQPRGITRGSTFSNYFDPNLGTPTMDSWNMTIEKEVMAETVVRARYVGNHQRNLRQNWNRNSATPDYVWFMTTGQPAPTGAYASVARRSYDQQVYGTIQEYDQTGWGNYQGFTLEAQRRYSKGYAFSISWVMGNSLMATGAMPQENEFMPGMLPAGDDAANRFLNYTRDTGTPKHRVKWDWVVDLPFGKGKPLAGNIGKTLDKFIGGWQLAGIGTLRSNWWSLPTGNWNFTGEPIKIYGYKYPIENCTSGACQPGYLWWNGYIPANRINSVDADGKPNGYKGIPSDYKPAVTPLIPWGSTTLPANAPANTNISQYWDTNNVWIPLKNGQVQRTAYSPGLHPWRQQYFPGVRQWGLDASLVKNIPFGERFNVRFNADFFNVLNAPGNPNSIGGDGMLSTRSSGQGPRTLQFSARLSW
jgi:hypothetical protein